MRKEEQAYLLAFWKAAKVNSYGLSKYHIQRYLIRKGLLDTLGYITNKGFKLLKKYDIEVEDKQRSYI